MLVQPLPHFGVFVGAVVIQDQMEGERLGVTRIQGAQELPELLMAVPWQTLTDDFTLHYVQCRKPGRGSVAHIVMGARAAAALLERQAGLRAIQRLNLALPIHAQDPRLAA